MKTLVCFILLFPLLAFSQNRTSEVLLENGLKKYPVEKAVLTYEISGGAEGEEVLIFDRYGWRSLKKRTMSFKLYGEERSQTQHEISDGKIVRRVNHSDSTYQERIDIRWSSLASRMTPVEASESMLFSLGGNYASDSTLLGKKCQVWTFENKSLMEMWVWQGLALKRKSKLGDLEIVTTASNIQLDGAIDPSVFELPKNYELKK